MKTREEIIHGMCLTWDHSYGAPVHPDDYPLPGGKQRDKDALLRSMSQVFHHDIAPILAAANEMGVLLAEGIGIVEGIEKERDDLKALVAGHDELLAACEALLRFNEELCEDVGVSTHYPSAEQARKVIKKAKGESP